MSNLAYISKLNPVEFYELNKTQVAKYISRPFSDYPFRIQNAAQPWQNQLVYKQKWQKSDFPINLQFTSNFTPIRVDVIDHNDIVRISQDVVVKRENIYVPGYYVYELALDLSSLRSGTYFLKTSLNATKFLISEPIDLQDLHKNTLLFEYRNSRYHGDILFETGIDLSFRVEGVFGFLQPGSESVMYKDQRLNPTVLSSRTFNSLILKIGGAKGVPDWVVEKMNNIFSCNDVRIDGKNYSLTEDSEMEYIETERYMLRGINMQVTEGINRGSKIFSVEVNTDKRLIVVMPVDSTVYGDTSSNAGQNIIQILATE